MGDFTGFTFGGIKTSDLGILRVSGGDRYEEQILPEIKDRSVEIPGLNGEYYFGSDYGTRVIDLDIAFDYLTESQFRQLRKVFSTKSSKSLIFDERPYKKYIAKLESPIELSYVCFDAPYRTIGEARDGVRIINRTETTTTRQVEGNPITDDEGNVLVNEGSNQIVNTETIEVTETVITREEVTPYVYDYSHTQRIYKGEGKISFVCYFPFAKSAFKIMPEGTYEWAESSGILTSENYAEFDTYDEGVIKVYNPGDVATGFRLYLPAAVLGNQIGLTYQPTLVASDENKYLLINSITLKDEDVGVLVDTNNQLIIGVSEFGYDISGNATYKTSGNIYNEYVEAGQFFQLETNNSMYDGATIQVTNGAEGIEIFYDYLYF